MQLNDVNVLLDRLKKYNIRPRLQFLHQFTANSQVSDTGSAAYRLAQNVKARKSKSV